MVQRHLTLPHEFIVFTDDTQHYPEPIVKRPLPHPGLTGWFNKIALFKPGVFEAGDRIVYLDLDTLICGSLDEIASYDGEHARMAPFFRNVAPPFDGPQSGVMAWRGGFGDKIWRTYELTGYPQNLKGGDQALLNRLVPNPDLLQALYPGKIGSFKGECGIIQPERSILCFHGLPRMHQVFPHGWADVSVPVSCGKKKLGGFWFPEQDSDCWVAMLACVDVDIACALEHTPGRRVCIQAGGNVGVYPIKLAKHFGSVLTIEPDPANFDCLDRNISEHEVGMAAIRGALGDASGSAGIVTCPENVGKSRISGEGDVMVMRIDELTPAACDLIYLDIEGYEMKALRGAVETIRKHKPTIIIEDNGLSEHYGVAKGETPAWLCSEFGYTIAAEIGRDVILIPGRN
jgi:FkbM family methyltransferase